MIPDTIPEIERICLRLKKRQEDNYRLIRTKDQLKHVVDTLKDAPMYSLDTETADSEDGSCGGKIVAMSLFTPKLGPTFIPVNFKEEMYEPILAKAKTLPTWKREMIERIWDPRQLSMATINEALEPIFLDRKKVVIGHNFKFDWHIMTDAGADIKNIVRDTLVEAWMIDENAFVGLKPRVLREFHVKMTEFKQLVGQGNRKERLDELTIPFVSAYAMADAKWTWKLDEKYTPELHRLGLTSVFEKLMMPLLRILYQMERRGIRIDTEQLDKVDRRVSTDIAIAIRDIDKALGRTVNLNSTKQLREILYGKQHLNLKPIKWTSGGKKGKPEPSTDEETLTELAKINPVCSRIVDLRGLSKIKGTYIDGIRSHLKEGRIHTNFRMGSTVTGRLSSSDPNCLSMDTEILTDKGFMKCADLHDIEHRYKIACFNKKNGQVQFDYPKKVWESSFKEQDMVSVESQHFHMQVTANHRCLFQDRKTGKYSVRPASEFLRDSKVLHGARFMSGDAIFPSLAYVQYLVAIQADAEIIAGDRPRFVFKKKRKYDRLKGIISTLGLPVRKDQFKNGKYEVIVDDGSHVAYMPNKRFTWEFINMQVEERITFLNELMYWDGSFTRKQNYSSSVESNVDIVQALFSLDGKRAHKRKYKSPISVKWNYQLDICNRDYTLTANAGVKRYKKTCRVWCVQVPTGFFIARRGSDTFITGNCQNIPARVALGKEIRNMFIADPGDVLIVGDLKNIELRMLAHFSKDPVMIKAFHNGEDLHYKTAQTIFHTVKPTSEQRRNAKTVNFGIVYGQGHKSLAEELGVTPDEAQGFINGVFRTYPAIGPWIESIHNSAQNRGYVRTMLGRYRRLPDINTPMVSPRGTEEAKKEWAKRSYAQRQSVNSIIQGSSFDYLTLAMIKLYPRLPLGCKLLLQVHDELVFSCRKAVADKAMEIIKYCMENPFSEGSDRKLLVPIEVDITNTETCWGNAKH